MQSSASFSLFAWFDMIIVSSDTWCAFLRIYCRCNLLHCGSYERYIHKYTYICSRRSFMKEAVHINAIFHLFFWPSDLMQSSLHRTVQRVLSTFILHHFIKLMFLNVLQFVMNWLFIFKYDQNIVLGVSMKILNFTKFNIFLSTVCDETARISSIDSFIPFSHIEILSLEYTRTSNIRFIQKLFS